MPAPQSNLVVQASRLQFGEGRQDACTTIEPCGAGVSPAFGREGRQDACITIAYGKPMIAPSLVREIKRLLAEGKYSQRKIARLTGVSRGTVGAIASGRRPDYEARASEREMELDEPTGPPQRCGGCGGLVYMPCRLCRVRTLIRQSQIARPPVRPEPRLELELCGDHRARYERVHVRRMQEGPGRGGK